MADFEEIDFVGYGPSDTGNRDTKRALIPRFMKVSLHRQTHYEEQTMYIITAVLTAGVVGWFIGAYFGLAGIFISVPLGVVFGLIGSYLQFRG